ncbi:MAG: hypothetical protein ACYDH0_09285 [Candidatus Aminicenantales bacterium]
MRIQPTRHIRETIGRGARRGIGILGIIILGFGGLPLSGREVIRDERFALETNTAGITSLKSGLERSGVEYLRRGTTLGHVRLRYRMGEGNWLEFDTEALSDKRAVNRAAAASAPQFLIVYNGSGWYDYFAELELTERFRLDGDSLIWTLHLRNVTDKPIEIAEFAMPLPFDVREDASSGTAGAGLAVKAVLAGTKSSVSWTRPDGVFPGLVMTPVDRCPAFEPAQHERNFAAAEIVDFRTEKGIPTAYLRAPGKASSGNRGGAPLKLWPKFTPDDEITYVFRFRWEGDGR